VRAGGVALARRLTLRRDHHRRAHGRALAGCGPEFSFFLAIPTWRRSVFTLWEARHDLIAGDLQVFAIGLVTRRGLVGGDRLPAPLGARPRPPAFGWYRLALAALIVLIAGVA